MSTVKKQCRTRGVIQALLLALLLNLSGHTFLHLSDASLETGEPQYTAHEEPRGLAAPAHQCSVCQDHQQRLLDTPTTAAMVVAAATSLTKQPTAVVPVVPSRQTVADRAPPRA
ncbi:MAG: hypothetical protein U0Y68_24575 [Blastocatellia bacterium]